MTALILQATPFVEMVAPPLRAAYLRLLHALDAFAEAKMRKTEREINRSRRLMRAGR